MHTTDIAHPPVEYRTVNISKGMTEFAYVQSGQIGLYLDDVQKLVVSTKWELLNRDSFAKAAANVFAYLNQAHPFREGNGRTSKIFMEHVAERSGFTLDFARVSPKIWNNASMLSCPDLGKYHPEPDSLIPVFWEIAKPRLT